MPKFRSDEPPEQVAGSSLLGLAIIGIVMMGIAVLFVRGDLTGNQPLQARDAISDATAPGR